MREQLEQIKQSALAALDAASTPAALEELRVKLLGKKGEMTAVLKQMGKLAAEERPVMGQLANSVRAQIEEKKKKGPVLLDIEPNGAKRVKDAAPDTTLIFIMPPDMQELERRLRDRKDTSEEQIAIRLERARWEMEQRSWYDHVVVNDDAQRCADEILSIIA